MPTRLLLSVLMLLPLLGAAETGSTTAASRPVYVTDRLVVAVRATPGARGAPLELLPSGTALELLNRQDGHARVRTADGVTGWVEQIYLSAEPTAAARLAALEAGLPTASTPPPPPPAHRLTALEVGAGVLISMALVALGFATGLAHQVRRERTRLYGLRL